MKPGDRIIEFRKKNKISQKKFAKLLDFSQPYINQIEKCKRKPSRQFLEKLNKIFGVSSDYILYGQTLPAAKNIDKFVFEGMMPLKFIERLKKDIENLPEPKKEFYSSLNIPKEIIDSILKGKGILTKTSVIELAQKLNQPVYEYLILSHYMPDEITKFTDYPGIIDLFKQISMLTPGELDEVLQTISGVLKPYVKKYGSKNE